MSSQTTYTVLRADRIEFLTSGTKWTYPTTDSIPCVVVRSREYAGNLAEVDRAGIVFPHGEHDANAIIAALREAIPSLLDSPIRLPFNVSRAIAHLPSEDDWMTANA